MKDSDLLINPFLRNPLAGYGLPDPEEEYAEEVRQMCDKRQETAERETEEPES